LVFFFLFISHFNGWHGGWANGPRYLVPAIPFLMAPAVFGFIRFPKLSVILLIVSTAIQLFGTAVDSQSPIGIAGNAVEVNLIAEREPLTGIERIRIAAKEVWKYNPLAEYILPLFLTERAWPLLQNQRDFFLSYRDLMMQRDGVSPERRESAWKAERSKIDAAILKGQPTRLLIDPRSANIGVSELPAVAGPVSANPMGMYEGKMHALFPPHSTEARWNSFNAGEFLFAQSRFSLIPLILACGGLLLVGLKMAWDIETAGRALHQYSN
jgi:hypothetical protein